MKGESERERKGKRRIEGVKEERKGDRKKKGWCRKQDM